MLSTDVAQKNCASVLEDELDDEPIAADMRKEADGPELAKVKLIAGLVGIEKIA